MTRYFALLPAAGSGARMSADKPKQYLTLQNKTIIEWALMPFLNADFFEKVIVVLSKEDDYFATLDIASHPKIITTLGANTRAGSVLAGLQALENIAAAEDYIFVHDAARPFISAKDILSLKQTVENHAVGGFLAIRAKNTIKQIIIPPLTRGEISAADRGDFYKDSLINPDCRDALHASQGRRDELPLYDNIKTLDRNTLLEALTPQAFRYGLLKKALMTGLEKQLSLTDCASSIEAMGLTPAYVIGDDKNIKITSPFDLRLAEFLLNS
jgi:2-C-methyl-D-erythritol 4-phosphate cytidylyltransferase